MADEADAKLLIEPDEPAFVQAIGKMAAAMEARFKKSGDAMKGASTAWAGIAPGQTFSQSPVAQQTKEMEKQLKWAKEITKTERERREIARARRFESNRSQYGEDIELDENGNIKRMHGAQSGMRRAVGNIASGITAGANMFQGPGGFAQGGVQLGAAIGSMIAPEIAPILNAVAGVAMSSLNASDTVMETMLRGYQVGGFRGAAQGQGTTERLGGEGGITMNQWREWNGFDYERFSNLQSHLGRKTGGLNNLPLLMGVENAFGTSGQAVNMLGASARSGHSPSSKEQERALGNAMALAMSQSLERGRFGEVFDQLTSAIEANTKGVSNVDQIANRFMFISQLGPQYRGNSAASKEMNQSLQGLAQGNKPYTQLAMLRAAGFGQSGVSYASAWLRAQHGLDVAGGVSSEDMIRTNFGQYIPAYRRGNADQRASIVMILSQLTGMNGAQVKVIMDRLASGPMGHLDPAAGLQRLNAEANMGGDAQQLIKMRQQKTIKERVNSKVGHFTSWLGGNGDRRDVLSSNPAVDNAPESGVQGGGAGGPAVGGSGGGGAAFNENAVFNNSEFVNDWIRMESGWNIQSRDVGVGLEDWRGARGYAQLTREEARGLGITSDADFRRLSTDPKYSMEMSKKLIASKVAQAQWVAAQHKLKWNQQDMLKLTKYEHGGSGFVEAGLQQFVKQVGRNPTGWNEYYQTMNHKLQSDSRYGVDAVQAQRALDNANNIKTGSGNVQVTVTVQDRTQNGVDVKKETESYNRQAQKPSPGNVPITSPDQLP